MSTWGSTVRQQVEITLTDRRLIAGEIHLQPYAQNHAGQETPIDLLNRIDPFFAVTLDGEVPIFLSKAHVLYLRLGAQPSITDPDRASAAKSMSLELELADGVVFEGMVTLELPPSRARALDFLNMAPPFFALWTPEAVRLINRVHVRAVSPL
jgi:hypothetical protein